MVKLLTQVQRMHRTKKKQSFKKKTVYRSKYSLKASSVAKHRAIEVNLQSQCAKFSSNSEKGRNLIEFMGRLNSLAFTSGQKSRRPEYREHEDQMKSQNTPDPD